MGQRDRMYLSLQTQNQQWGKRAHMVAVYEMLRIKILKGIIFQHLSCSSFFKIRGKGGLERDHRRKQAYDGKDDNV